MRKKIEVEKWQIILFCIGALMIIAGLILTISWQQGFVQLKWLQCPQKEIPFA
jgi:hypothetical protein